MAEQVNLIEKLDAFYTPRSSQLGALAKEQIGRTMLGLSQRGGDLGTKAATFLNKSVRFGGDMVPAWKSFQSDKLDDAFMRFDHSVLPKESDPSDWVVEWAKIYAGLSHFAGSKGNRFPLVKNGYSKGFTLYESLTNAQRKKVDEEVMQYGLPQVGEGYYFLQKRHSPADWTKMVAPFAPTQGNEPDLPLGIQ